MPNASEKSGQVEKCVPCANPACKYQVTWHATHCCGGCANGLKHGPRCEHREVGQSQEDKKVEKDKSNVEKKCATAENEAEKERTNPGKERKKAEQQAEK